MSYLDPGLPIPVPAADGLDAPFFEGLAEGILRIQRCTNCGAWQWGPEWVCHQCLSFDLAFEEVAPVGTIYSYERIWHPVHPALENQGPYRVVLVSIEGAPGVRMVGNLLGDPNEPVTIGERVTGVFEHHEAADPPHTLLQWELAPS